MKPDATLRLSGQRAAYQQQTALVQGAKDSVTYAEKEVARQKQMLAAGVSSQQQLDQAGNALQQASSRATRLGPATGGAGPGQPRRQSQPRAVQASPLVMQAQARLDRAKLNISYTTVVAPADGIVTRVEQLPVGTYLNASQTAFWLLSGRPWIEANFKEDQLAHMKVGQSVSIKVDAYPDANITGHVASFSPGTGQAFSALPAQNATGNWVKVVQRLPVRVDFDKPPPGMAARAGLSAKVKVDVRAAGRAG